MQKHVLSQITNTQNRKSVEAMHSLWAVMLNNHSKCPGGAEWVCDIEMVERAAHSVY